MKTLWAVLLVVAFIGCQAADVWQGDYNSQGVKISFKQEAVDAVVEHTTTGPVLLQPAAPRTETSYEISPEVQRGDVVKGTRGCSWMTPIVESIVKAQEANRQQHEQRPLPEVNVDATGVHAAQGGGSESKETGIDWWSRTKLWASHVWDSVTGWFWLIIVLGAAVFILPIFIPGLAPVVAAVGHALMVPIGWVWDAFEKLVNWVKSKGHKTTPPTPPASSSSGA